MAKGEKESTPVAVAEDTGAALAAPQQSTELTTRMDQLFQEDSGLGMKEAGAGDYAIPFLAVMQKGSPQVSRASTKYVKDATVGQIFNTVTNELYDGDEGIEFIPCGFQKRMVRWKHRDDGGGLVCSYKEGDPTLKTFKRDDRGRLYDEESNDVIVDTCYHLGMLLHGNGFPEFAVISMTSTQLKTSRNWMTIIRRIMKRSSDGKVYNPPQFSHVYRIKTIPQQKQQYDWYGFAVAVEREVTDVELYKACRAFAKEIDSGNVRVSAPPQEFEDTNGDDSVPF